MGLFDRRGLVGAAVGRFQDQDKLDKFAESKAKLNDACRGYKDINMLAIKLLNPGGYLLTFSCSGLMETSLFQKIVADAAIDANRDMVFVERLSQAQDHIVGSAYPEGFYLKGFVCQVF